MPERCERCGKNKGQGNADKPCPHCNDYFSTTGCTFGCLFLFILLPVVFFLMVDTSKVNEKKEEQVKSVEEKQRLIARSLKFLSKIKESDYSRRVSLYGVLLKYTEDGSPEKEEYRKQYLHYSELYKKQRIEELNKEVESLPEDDVKGRLKLYSKLLIMDPRNMDVRMKLISYSARAEAMGRESD